MTLMGHEVHPAAALFPMMADDELGALAADIAEHGLVEPIKVSEGKVLDGRNRLVACDQAGVEARFEEVEPPADPVAYVVSLNVKRRNLRRDQLAIAAAEAWPMYEVGQGARTDLGPDQAEVRTRDRLAKVFGVGRDAIQQARKLVQDAPEAAARVKAGGASLAGAYDALVRIDRERAEAQREIERLQRSLETMGTTPDADLLPPPADLDREIEERRGDVEAALTQIVSLSEERPGRDVEAWEKALREGRAAAGALRSLPPFPGVRGELVRLPALDTAKVLYDAAARLVQAVPTLEQSNELRRVK